MGQQVADRNLSLCRFSFQWNIGHQHRGILELGDDFDTGSSVQLALLPQHHDGRAGYRLGHGGDTENGIRLHGRPSFPIRHANRRQVNYFSVASHHRHATGNLATLQAIA